MCLWVSTAACSSYVHMVLLKYNITFYCTDACMEAHTWRTCEHMLVLHTCISFLEVLTYVYNSKLFITDYMWYTLINNYTHTTHTHTHNTRTHTHTHTSRHTTHAYTPTHTHTHTHTQHTSYRCMAKIEHTCRMLICVMCNVTISYLCLPILSVLK